MTSPAQRPLGYAALIQRFDLRVMPPWHVSQVTSGVRRHETIDGVVQEYFPATYDPGEDLGDQLEFALKYDGVDLAILSHVFIRMGDDAIRQVILAKPTGIYRRRLWYFAELLLSRQLDLADTLAGTYTPLLDPDQYLVAAPRPSRRHRVIDNLLGDARFCPLIRRTKTLEQYANLHLDAALAAAVKDIDPHLLQRAVSWLYNKETMSSFAIEREIPSASRTERFMEALSHAGSQGDLDKQDLIRLQNGIVDPRFADHDYRTSQNYVGSLPDLSRQVVHYVSPKPEDVPLLMDGFLACLKRSCAPDAGIDPVAAAAAIAFGFVFIHPFEDGNGRLHRYLVHHVLARRGFTPPGLVMPISATILADLAAYDRCLERFSKPIMRLVEYQLDDQGVMIVTQDTGNLYRYPDLTATAEYLYGCVDSSVRTDLADELAFLIRYDRAKSAIQTVVDLPDRLIDLFIRLTWQHQGRLSAAKRASHFARLTDAEIAQLEQVVVEASGQTGNHGNHSR